ncbi:unnamed protein product, partial [Symbiodinium necroappetens]
AFVSLVVLVFFSRNLGCLDQEYRLLWAEIRLAIWLVLQGRLDSFYVLLATVCSSWVPTNAGTSKRSIIYAEGNTKLPYVADANCLTSRRLA